MLVLVVIAAAAAVVAAAEATKTAAVSSAMIELTHARLYARHAAKAAGHDPQLQFWSGLS